MTRSGHASHDRLWVMMDRQAAQLFRHRLDRFSTNDAGLHVERSGWFVAQEHSWPFGNGPSNGHSLCSPPESWAEM
jgi:hypothetical protein